MRSDQSHTTARKCLRPAVVSRNMRLCRKIHPELRKYRGTVAKTHSDQWKMVMGNRANEGIRSFEESVIQRISSCVFPPRCSYISSHRRQSCRPREPFYCKTRVKMNKSQLRTSVDHWRQPRGDIRKLNAKPSDVCGQWNACTTTCLALISNCWPTTNHCLACLIHGPAKYYRLEFNVSRGDYISIISRLSTSQEALTQQIRYHDYPRSVMKARIAVLLARTMWDLFVARTC